MKSSEPMSILEAFRSTFFDKLGITYDFKPKIIKLSSGHRICPNFYLPQFNVWAIVSRNKLNDFESFKAMELCTDLKKPVLILDQIDFYSSYTAFLYNKSNNSKLDVIEFNLIPDQNSRIGFLENHYYTTFEDFVDHGSQGIKASLAFRAACYTTTILLLSSNSSNIN